MKFSYLIIPFVTLILVGCSETYKVTDFNSKNDFNEYVNKHIKDREVNVTLKNDSTFTTNENGAQVNQNFLTLKLYKSKDTTLLLDEIQNINYNTNFGNPSVHLKLKNGNTINAENIRRSANSLEFNTKFPYSYNISINKVNEINYKTHLSGIIAGFLTGTLTGGLIGATGLVFKPRNGGNPPLQVDTFQAAIAGALVGAIIGPIVGYFIGHSYNFEFR